MKKLLLLLLCVPLLFSCGENNEEESEEGDKYDCNYGTEEGKLKKEKENKDTTELTTNFNGIIEINEDGYYILRNTSKNKKYEFTVSMYGQWSSVVNELDNGEEEIRYSTKQERTKTEILSPGAIVGISERGKDITYTIIGEFEIK